MKKLPSLSVSLAVCLSTSTAVASGLADCPQLASSAPSQSLDRRVEAGDRQAAFCLARSLDSLDGGELEDSLVALGQFGDRRPVELLSLAHRGTLSRHSLAEAVGALPLSLTDNMHGQLQALKLRQARYRRIAQPQLAGERRLVLQSIESALTEIRPHLPSR